MATNCCKLSRAADSTRDIDELWHEQVNILCGSSSSHPLCLVLLCQIYWASFAADRLLMATCLITVPAGAIYGRQQICLTINQARKQKCCPTWTRHKGLLSRKESLALWLAPQRLRCRCSIFIFRRNFTAARLHIDTHRSRSWDALKSAEKVR